MDLVVKLATQFFSNFYLVMKQTMVRLSFPVITALVTLLKAELAVLKYYQGLKTKSQMSLSLLVSMHIAATENGCL